MRNFECKKYVKKNAIQIVISSILVKWLHENGQRVYSLKNR